jgi:predicted phosphodiesterase
MKRLLITGDTHGLLDIEKLNKLSSEELDKSDVLIILGDAGVCWGGNGEDEELQKFYENKKFTTFIVDGNHENHDLISELPIVERFGGKIRKVSNSVFYAIRGEVYEINGKRFLAIGGADSVDKEYRVEGLSWWEGETISESDILNALKNVNGTVDFLITHTGGSAVSGELGFPPSSSDKMLDKVIYSIDYKYHYLGHHHIDKILNEKTRILYDDIIEIKE